MNIVGETILFVLVFAGSAWGFDWITRMSYISQDYSRRDGHGKSWHRASTHYKKNWSLRQRLLFIPIFRDCRQARFRWFAYLAYIHHFWLWVTLGFFVANRFFQAPVIVDYFMLVFCYLTLLRFFMMFGKVQFEKDMDRANEKLLVRFVLFTAFFIIITMMRFAWRNWA